MKLFSKRLRSDSFSNLIAEGTIVTGDVTFVGTIKIQGSVRGDLLSEAVQGEKVNNCIIVDKGGEVTSHLVKTTDAILGGRVTSNAIMVEDTLRILSSAEIIGAEIYYRTLEIEPGALLNQCKLCHLDYSSVGEQV